MGKSAPKAPPAPDPVATAAAQTASNVDTARVNASLNRANQYTPYGSIEWSSPAVDRWESTVKLSPEQQRLSELQTAVQTQYGQTASNIMPRLSDMMGQPINFAGGPSMGQAFAPSEGLGTTITPEMYRAINPNITPEMMARLDPTITQYLQQGDIGGVQGTEQRQRVEDALFGRMQPQMDRDRLALENRLANQGLSPGSTPYATAMDQFGRQQNDARLGVVAAGGQEQQLQAGLANLLYGQRMGAAQNLFGQRMGAQQQQLQGAQALFGQQMGSQQQQLQGAQARFGQVFQGRQLWGQEQAQGFNQAEALRKQYLNELLMQRQVPMSEMAALLGGSAPQYPQFGNVPQTNVANTDVLGAYQMNQAGRNAAYQGEVANAGSFNQGLAGLGSSAIMAAFLLSDERAKDNIERVGKTDDGQPIYSYNYKGSDTTQLGLMAQDVEKRNPAAVATDPVSGFKMVDYAAALFGGKRKS